MTPARPNVRSSPPRVLYIHMCALGDAVMASPALRLLKSNLPDWKICVLARTQTQDYFRSLPYVDEVVPFVDERYVDRKKPWKLLHAPGEIARLVRELKNARYAVVIQWRGQLPDTLMSWCTGAPHRIAGVQSIHRRPLLPVEKMGFLVTDLVPVVDPRAHLVEALVAPVGYFLEKFCGQTISEHDLTLDFPLQEPDQAAADEFLRNEGLAPGAPFACVSISAKTAVNSWPLERFAAVADHLQHQHGLRVVLTGLPEHLDREQKIASRMSAPPIRTVSRLPFGVVCALLARSRLLVSLNTGISHIAAALRVPVVVLSGRDGANISPWGAAHRVVTRNPHYPRRHPDRRQWASLVPLITVEDVNESIDSLLNELHASRN